MAPAAMTGIETASANLRHESHQSHHLGFCTFGTEGAAVPAGFHSLGNDRICSGPFGCAGLVDCGGCGEPEDSVRFELCNERRSEEAHD